MNKTNLLFILLIMAIITALSGCMMGQVTGSGNIITRHFELTDFAKLKINSGFTVDIKASSSYSIEVSADDNLFNYIIVNKNDGTVSIGLKTGSYTQTNLKATIMMPDLQGLELQDGSDVNISGFSSSNGLTINLSDGSGVSGSIIAGDVVISLQDGTNVNLVGSANNLKVTSHDGSQAYLDNFTVNNADLTIGDGGLSTINVTGMLNVNLSAGSRVIYSGNPTMGTVNLSAGSSLIEKN